MADIVIIGSGSVAEGLAREISGSEDLKLVQIFARNQLRGQFLALENGSEWTDDSASLAPADLYIISVSDSAVASVSSGLPFPSDTVVAHTAGCLAMTEMNENIRNRAVIYPLQSFTKGRRIEGFRRIPFFIEGENPHALETVRRVARAISDNVVEMSSARRAFLHLAGAFANNFSNAMFSVAEEIAAGEDIPFDHLRPIISETVAKAMEMPSPRMAQTGAAQRGDRTIQDKHLALLAENYPDYVELYEEISRIIWKKTLKKN